MPSSCRTAASAGLKPASDRSKRNILGRLLKKPLHFAQRFVAWVWGRQFVRNVAVVVAGTAGAQVISMAFAPLITRMYGPEAFGLLGVFLAIVAVATPLAALAYPIAIVLPRDDDDAVDLVRLSAILSFLIALLVAAALWGVGDWLIMTLSAQSVSGYLFLIPIAMLFSAWMQIAQQWLIRKKEFGALARSALAHSLILNSAKSGIGWLHPISSVLIVIATLGQALYAGLLFFGARRSYSDSAIGRKQGPCTSLKVVALRHRDFPLYRAPQNFINAASASLPILMLSAFAGPMAAGFYTLARMVIGLPSTLVGNAVNDVLYPRITEAAYNGENLPRHLMKATGTLLTIGIVPFAIVVLFGPWLFSVVFGSDWAKAGEYARWLAIFFLFNFINKPAVSAAPVLGIQGGLLIYETFSTGLKVIALFFGFLIFNSDIIAVALFSISGVFSYIILILWVLRKAVQRNANGNGNGNGNPS
jgi:O-antigen/teichoic acid export membrane protein